MCAGRREMPVRGDFAPQTASSFSTAKQSANLIRTDWLVEKPRTRGRRPAGAGRVGLVSQPAKQTNTGVVSMASDRFRNPMSRRGFLTVGSIGLGGLTLADVLRIQARADLKTYAADRGQGRLGDPHLPPRRDRPPGDVRPQTVRADRISRRHGLDRYQDRRRAVQSDAAADRSDRRQVAR